MLHRLRRHPFAVDAHFDHALVLTYALPPAALEPLLAPGLRLETFDGHAFLAVALVQTRDLRPAGWPQWTGQDFFLSGYRIFTRFRTSQGKDLRGLRILRSDTDKRRMALVGNLLTHYRYRPCHASLRHDTEDNTLEVQVRSRDGRADLDVSVDLEASSSPPAGSPFPSLAEARKFAGPLPLTFDYEGKTGSIVAIEGQRAHWTPRPVSVRNANVGFLRHGALGGHEARLSNAFYVHGIDYRWLPGRLEAVPLGGIS